MNKLLKRIVNGEFINVVYNDDIYLLVDEFVCDKKHIIYFNSLNNELFCYKKGKDFEVIEEEKLIEKVKDENGLYKDEYLYHSKFKNMNTPSNITEITGGERRLIIEKFLDEIERLDVSIPRQDLFNKLLNLRIKRINKLRDLGIFGASSAYHIRSNTIYVRSDEYKDNVFFHELIHALTGKDSFSFNTLLGVGLIEGIAESKTIEAFHKNVSSSYNGYEYNFDAKNSRLYVENAAIASQLEYILGENLLKSLISKDSKFVEKFYRKYGLNTFISLRYGLNKMYRNNRKQINNNDRLDRIQDMLLRTVFDKEFESVVDEESAIKYFDTLNTFGLFRVRKDEEDSLLRDYFNKKKEECSKKLNVSLDSVKYEPVQFKNKFLSNEYNKRILVDARSYFSLNYKQGDRVKIYRANRDGKVYGLLYVNDELIFKKEYGLNGSSKTNIDFDMSELEEIEIEEEHKRQL